MLDLESIRIICTWFRDDNSELRNYVDQLKQAVERNIDTEDGGKIELRHLSEEIVSKLFRQHFGTKRFPTCDRAIRKLLEEEKIQEHVALWLHEMRAEGNTIGHAPRDENLNKIPGANPLMAPKTFLSCVRFLEWRFENDTHGPQLNTIWKLSESDRFRRLRRRGDESNTVDSINEPDDVTGSLPSGEGPCLGRESELAMLENYWADAGVGVVQVVGWGGAGKSRLINEWLNRSAFRKRDSHKGMHIITWSFYRPGQNDAAATSEEFFQVALRAFGEDTTQVPAYDRPFRLAQLVSRRRTLIVLDGLEVLQGDPIAGTAERKVIDTAVEQFLADLGRVMPEDLRSKTRVRNLCVVTTRYPFPAADQSTVRVEKLKPLSEAAGSELLRLKGASIGTDDDLREAVRDARGHALTLTLLGTYVSIALGGNIRRRKEIQLSEAYIFASSRQQRAKDPYGHAFRVLQAYELHLGDGPALATIRMASLFDRPVKRAEYECLVNSPPTPLSSLKQLGSLDWSITLDELCQAGLLEVSPDGQALDMHPLVREHFRKSIKKQNLTDYREAHSIIAERFLALASNYQAESQPSSGMDLKSCQYSESQQRALDCYVRAIAHTTEADQHNNAWKEIYLQKIRTPLNADITFTRLLSQATELSVLSHFFYPPFERPASGLEPSDAAAACSLAGYNLFVTGRLTDALDAISNACELWEKLDEPLEYARMRGTQARIHLARGDLKEVRNAIGMGLNAIGLNAISASDDPALQLDSWERQLVSADNVPTFRKNDIDEEDNDQGENCDDEGAIRRRAFQAMNLRFLEGTVNHLSGRASAAEHCFSRGRALRTYLVGGDSIQLASRIIQEAEYLVDIGKLDRSRELLRQAAMVHEKDREKYMLDAAVNAIVEGRLIAAEHEKKGQVFDLEVDGMSQTIETLRKLGRIDRLPAALTVRAELRMLAGHDPVAVQRDIEEAKEIAIGVGLRIAETNVKLLELEAIAKGIIPAKPADTSEYQEAISQLISHTGYESARDRLESLSRS